MADKIASSLKNLFKDDKKNQQKQRGVPANKDELIHWRTTNEFSKLPPRGQEAFFKYLRKGCYSEDKDIIDVDVTAEGMNNSSRRYQFWLKCQGINLTDLFVIYVDDDETKLPDVNTCFTTFKSKNNDKNIKQSEFLKEKWLQIKREKAGGPTCERRGLCGQCAQYKKKSCSKQCIMRKKKLRQCSWIKALTLRCIFV
ncbi:uncharacterized protein [Cherax quadricarinatus]|uniref:uncharacterized protein isoform X2 n=1 Tax=Cherax quadricarinatus TaxID=27406 RepID=UPI00387E9CFC